MKKLFLTTILAIAGMTAHAGGLMTNTNYHIAFDRMFARGATTEILGARGMATLAQLPEALAEP